MDIKILGSGCVKCQRLEQLTREVVDELGLIATFDHVRDLDKIMAYPVFGTPVLVVNERVKVAGRMPSKQEIAGWLRSPE